MERSGERQSPTRIRAWKGSLDDGSQVGCTGGMTFIKILMIPRGAWRTNQGGSPDNRSQVGHTRSRARGRARPSGGGKGLGRGRGRGRRKGTGRRKISYLNDPDDNVNAFPPFTQHRPPGTHFERPI